MTKLTDRLRIPNPFKNLGKNPVPHGSKETLARRNKTMAGLLSDPANAQSEPGASDLAGIISYTPTDEDKSLSALVAERFKDSLTHRRPHEAGWIEGLAHFSGKGWHFWDAEKGALVHWKTRSPLQNHRSYVNHPIIRPRARKLVARALTNQVNFSVYPLSDLPSDRDAADLTDPIITHVMERNDWPSIKFEAERLAIVWCPQYLTIDIDPRAPVALPLWGLDETGMYVEDVIHGYGPEIKFTRRSSFDIAGDPRSKDWKRWKYFIERSFMTYAEIRERWPSMADVVCSYSSADSSMNATGQAAIRSVAGDIAPQATPSSKRGAYVNLMWELPSPMFPETEEHGGGRVVYTADSGAGEGTLLQVLPFPKGLKVLPIAELAYESGIDSTYGGQSAVQPAVPAADDYDQMLSAVLDRTKEHTKFIFRTNLNIKHDAFQSGLANEAIPVNYTNPGPLSDVVYPVTLPDVPPSVMAMLQQANADVGEILEVQDVSRGVMPEGVTSGAAFKAMADSDQSTSTLFRQNQIECYQRVGEVMLALIPHVYGDSSRMLSLGDTGPAQEDMPEIQMMQQLSQVLMAAGVPQEEIASLLMPEGSEVWDGEPDMGEGARDDSPLRAGSKAFLLHSLSAGRVGIKADVKLVKSPQQRVADLMQLAQQGFLAPDMLETTLPLLQEMGFEESDKLTRRLTKALQRRIDAEKAKTPDPTEQAKAQADAQAQVAAAVAKAQGEATAEVNERKVVAETIAKAALAQQAHENNLEALIAQGQVVFSPEQIAALAAAFNVPPSGMAEFLATQMGATGEEPTGEEAGEVPEAPPMPAMPPAMPDPSAFADASGFPAPPETASPGAPLNPGGEV